MSAIYTLGIDVGSTASKCIMLKDGQEIVAKSLIDVGAGTSGPQRAIDAVLENAGMKKEDVAFFKVAGIPIEYIFLHNVVSKMASFL